MSKPERVAGFDSGLADRLRSIINGRNAALVEVAGRDSIAAAVAASQAGTYTVLIPTVVYTGTEFGDWQVVLESARSLEQRSEFDDVMVFDEPVVLGSPGWWQACAGRYAGELHRTYGFSTTCIACHMYLHAVRVPFAREIGARALVAGERLLHDGRVKLNQLAGVLEAYERVVAGDGIMLDLPIRDINEGVLVEELAGSWPESKRQMSCALESNYRDAAGGAYYSEDGLSRYLDEFLVPFTESVLAHFVEGTGAPDYTAISRGLLWGRSSG